MLLRLLPCQADIQVWDGCFIPLSLCSSLLSPRFFRITVAVTPSGRGSQVLISQPFYQGPELPFLVRLQQLLFIVLGVLKALGYLQVMSE